MTLKGVCAIIAAAGLLAAVSDLVATDLPRQPIAGETLGSVEFPVSCTAEAQRRFNRAMQLYHNFYFPAARKAFDAVLEADPACAMGDWGHAMVSMDNPFQWPLRGKALGEGWARIEKARSLGAKTEREGLYVAAVEVFFQSPEKGVDRTRQLAYEVAMDALVRRYPADTEAQILHALAVSANFDPNDKSYVNQKKAAAILEPIWDRQPDHPGVAHYIVHSYDYPPIAHLGVPAARRYSAIAASAPHAQHMPSHIFTRVGAWRESIASNRMAAKIAAASDPRQWLHANDYMVYAHLQLGQEREAKAIVDQVLALQRVPEENFVAAHAVAAIPARYAVERGRWQDAARLALSPAEPDFAWQQFPHAEAILVYARGLGAARSGDPAGARREVERLAKLKEAMLEAKLRYWADQVDIQTRVVDAWIARAGGRNDEALRLMRAAADHEDSTEKNTVTPGPIKPARELLGELLLELGQPAQALLEFEATMGKEPNRLRGLYGAARAAERAGDAGKAREYYARLASLGETADPSQTEVETAKRFLARR